MKLVESPPKTKCPYCAQGEMGRLAGAVRCSHCSKVLDYAEDAEKPMPVEGLGTGQNESEAESL